MCRRYFVLCSVMLAGCMQQQAAMIEYHGTEFYGRERSMAMLGNNKQSERYADRYVPVAQREFMNAPTYDSVAVSSVESRDLSPTPAAYSPQQQQPMKLINYNAISTQASPNTHIVKAGETFYRISKNNGITVEQLQAANNLKPDSKLAVGQRLVIPKAKTATAPQKPLQMAVYNQPSRDDAPPAQSSSGYNRPMFIRPVAGEVISEFGVKGTGRKNDGINIKAMAGTPVKAAAAGSVVYVGSDLEGYGKMIIISHTGGWMTAYAHNSDVFVTKNQKVRQGEVISHVGASGGVKEPQLHFSIRHDKQAIDPETVFDNQLASSPAI